MYKHIRPYEIRDTSKLMDEMCHDLEIELLLYLLESGSFDKVTITEDEGRLDITATGLWGLCFTWCFIDGKIFNSLTKKHPTSFRSLQTSR